MSRRELGVGVVLLTEHPNDVDMRNFQLKYDVLGLNESWLASCTCTSQTLLGLEENVSR